MSEDLTQHLRIRRGGSKRRALRGTNLLRLIQPPARSGVGDNATNDKRR